MKIKHISMIVLLWMMTIQAMAQQVKWMNPMDGDEPYICGRAWNKEMGKSYDRLPERFAATLPKNVWSLKAQTAGVIVRFVSNSKTIRVRYGCPSNNYNGFNMTGINKSGVDLYGKTLQERARLIISVADPSAQEELDRAAFDREMQEQKTRAREARKALGDLGWAGVEFGKDVPETQFVGYDHTAIDDAKVVALVVENEQAEELMPGVEAIVVLDKTPFYAEMGGQVADHGVISADGVTFQVTDVQKNKGGKYMHTGKLTQGVLKVGGTVSASIDVKRRKAVMRAHSATHLLDAVLHQVLGDHVHQAGSLVEPDKLRFDFTHFAALTAEELSQVSALVNEAVLEGYEVSTEVLPIEEAKQRGAIALFGEKYGDTVRVVDMGQGFSVEFCGGTHLDNTAKVGVFHIDSEFSVASGVRRIEATTGLKSLETMNRAQSLLFETAAVLKAKPAELREKAEQNMAELREMRHTVEKFQAREAAGETERFLMGGHDLGELKVLTATLPNADAAKLRQMGDMLRDKQPNVVAVLSAVNDGKITFLAVCGKEAVSKGVKAGDIIKNVTTICGGKGGGKPDSAMGGGNDLLKLDDALAKVDDLVAEKLGL